MRCSLTKKTTKKLVLTLGGHVMSRFTDAIDEAITLLTCANVAQEVLRQVEGLKSIKLERLSAAKVIEVLEDVRGFYSAAIKAGKEDRADRIAEAIYLIITLGNKGLPIRPYRFVGIGDE